MEPRLKSLHIYVQSGKLSGKLTVFILAYTMSRFACYVRYLANKLSLYDTLRSTM